MEVLFSLGEASLAELAGRMESPPTRPALRSVVKILEEKGHVVTGGKRGREILYRPRPEPAREGRAAWGRILDTFFGGSLKDGLASYLADPSVEIDKKDLKALEKLIRDARKRGTKP